MSENIKKLISSLDDVDIELVRQVYEGHPDGTIKIGGSRNIFSTREKRLLKLAERGLLIEKVSDDDTHDITYRNYKINEKYKELLINKIESSNA